MGGGGMGFPIFFRLAAFPVSESSNGCDFSILTTISSPNPLIIKGLNVGQSLSLKETETMRALEVRTAEGHLCGVVLSNIRKITGCMAKGVLFSAKVVILNGAECQILIQQSKLV